MEAQAGRSVHYSGAGDLGGLAHDGDQLRTGGRPNGTISGGRATDDNGVLYPFRDRGGRRDRGGAGGSSTPKFGRARRGRLRRDGRVRSRRAH
jgi:hypothetical protein